MSTEYHDYGYTAPEPGRHATNRPMAKLFVAAVKALPEVDTVCDLGCGNGYLAAALGDAGYTVTGIDASKSGIEVARRHHQTEKVRFLQAAIGVDPIAAEMQGAFDAVVSSDVIEHLYRPAALIETAALLLRPGGHLLVGTPYHGYWKNLAISLLDKWDSHHDVAWDGGHIKFFSVKTLRELVLRYGFTDTRFHYYGRFAWLWKNMICHARRRTDHAE